MTTTNSAQLSLFAPADAPALVYGHQPGPVHAWRNENGLLKAVCDNRIIVHGVIDQHEERRRDGHYCGECVKRLEEKG